MEFPKAGDFFEHCLWYQEKNPGCTDDQMVENTLKFFEADIWCQRAKLRSLRSRANRDRSLEPSLVEATERLERTLMVLTLKSNYHYLIREYREDLRLRRLKFETFQRWIPEYPYDVIEMEIIRSKKEVNHG